MPLFHMKQKCHPFGWHLSLSIKSVFTPKQQSRGSAHSKAFAAQTHENRGRVPRFSYFKREKVSVWELSDVRVLRSQNTDCRKNEVFRQSKREHSGMLCSPEICGICSLLDCADRDHALDGAQRCEVLLGRLVCQVDEPLISSNRVSVMTAVPYAVKSGKRITVGLISSGSE